MYAPPFQTSAPTPLMTARERLDRRNARERQHVQRRKRTMEEMRALVDHLEQEKRALEAQYGQQQLLAAEVAAIIGTGEEDDPFHVAQRRYLDVLQQVEQLRLENRSLAEEMNKRDIFRNAVHDIADQMPPDIAHQPKPPGPPHPVSREDAHALVLKVFKHLHKVHQRMDHDGPDIQSTQTEVFGWTDCRCDVGARVDFVVKKNFYNDTAAGLSQRTWDLFSAKSSIARLIPAVMRPGPVRHFPQIVDRNTIIIHGAGHDADNRISRTCSELLIARAVQRGRWMLIMGYFEAANIADHLASNHPLDECFSWYYEDFPADLARGMGPCARVQLGGSLINVSDAMVRNMIAEHIFIVVRWETIVTSQRCLVWGNTDDDTTDDNANETDSTASSC